MAKKRNARKHRKFAGATDTDQRNSSTSTVYAIEPRDGYIHVRTIPQPPGSLPAGVAALLAIQIAKTADLLDVGATLSSIARRIAGEVTDDVTFEKINVPPPQGEA